MSDKMQWSFPVMQLLFFFFDVYTVVLYQPLNKSIILFNGNKYT